MTKETRRTASNSKTKMDRLGRPKLTARQQKVLDFLIYSIEVYGYPPTLREIGVHMGIKSTNGVSDHLKALERKGYIKKSSLRARALIPILEPAPPAPEPTVDPKQGIELPLVGRVAAGVPIPRIQSSGETLTFDPALFSGSGEMFILEVQGDSMINDGIHEGDYLIIRKQPEANNGEIVVAVIDNEVTVKRFYRESKATIRLQPANDNLSPIYLTASEWKNVSVLGVSVGLYRKY